LIFFLAACTTLRPEHAPLQKKACRNGVGHALPWENASRLRLENGTLRHSFQDANYHDQIVKEHNKPFENTTKHARMHEKGEANGS
jgi:hypothetical protein